MSVVVLSVPAAAAGARDLDRLFAALSVAETPAQAAAIEGDIWSAWIYAGDADTDELMDRGIYAMEQGLLPLAAEIFTTIIANAPDVAEGWNKRATVRYMMGNLGASVGDIGKTLEREPRHFGALSGLGLIYLARGQDRAALKVFERVLVIYPQMPSARAHVRALRDKIKESEI